ncbi:MAG: hypothetical protein NTV54_11750 [Ignavibacteriales bacterium]|nr:hypothetical protein [Ignavibacteriales bacterium]
MARTASKIFYYVSVVVLLILLIVVGYTQTVSFKKSLRSTALASAEEYLNAKIYLGEIKGNLFTGFQVDTVAMYVDGSLCAMIQNVDLHYDPLALWNKHIALTSLELTHPSFALIRYRDGSWNVDRIVKQKSEPDTTPSPWTIVVKRLKIDDAHFRVYDSTASPVYSLTDSLARRKINFSDLDLRGINLDLSAEISAAEQYVAIRRLTCESPREEFEIRSFAANVRHNKTATSVDDFRLKTAASSIELSAKTVGVDVFTIKDIASLKHVPVRAIVRQSTVSSFELQQFLPELYFLHGSVDLNLSVSGEFGDLAIEDLRADFSKTHLNLRGALRKLDTPKLLTLDVESRGSILHPADAPELLPYFHIPSFPNIGDIEVNFHYTGMPLDFAVVMSARTDAGDFSVDGSMDLTEDVMKYKAEYSGRGVDVERFFDSPSLRSYINCSGAIEGRGTSLEDLATGVTFRADSSLWNNIPISQLRASLTVEQKTIAAILGVRSLRGDISFHSNLTFLGIVPTYSISGTGSNVDLAALFHDDYYSSALSFDFAGHASDTDLEKVRGLLQIDFRESRFRSFVFDSVHASVSVATDSLNNKVVKITSPVADASLSGTFSYGSLIRKITHQFDVLRATYQAQRAMFDTVKTGSMVTTNPRSAVDTANRAQNASLRYSLRLKNLAPLALFLDERPFNAVGDIDGSIDVDRDVLSAHGTIDLKTGRYVLSDGDIALENMKFDFAVNNISGTGIYTAQRDPTLTASLASGTLFVDGAEFHNLAFEYDYRQHRAAFSFRGDLDTTLSAVCSGSVVFSDSEYAIRCKRLSAVFQGYDVAATSPFGVRLGARGVAVDSVTFRHDDEEITLQGVMGFHGTIFGHAVLKDFPLSNISHFGRGAEFRESAQRMEGKVQAEISVTGGVRSPEIRGSISIADLGFRGTPFGNINGMVRYEGRVASVSMQQARPNLADSLYEFLVVGSIPMDLAFASVAHRFDLGGMDLYFRAKGFQMSIIDPFIGEVDDMRGELQSAIHCTGSLASPLFSGTASLRNGEFLLRANGMKYRAEGSMELQDTTVTMTSFVMRNLANEYSDGRMDITGRILMRGFVPNEYHLTARGELKVLQDAGRSGRAEMYGDLVAATGDDGFRFEGTSARSQVRGTILLRQADLTFPSSKQAQATLASRYVTVSVVDDTSKALPDTAIAPSLLLRKKQATQFSAEAQSTFLDGLGYDLTIQTQGVIKVRMMFNQATSEELFADLNGKLTLSKEQDNVRLIGSINVSERSYYTFYKKFDASGTLTFTGKPDNPQLDIKAQYSGTHLNVRPDTAITEKVTVSLSITGNRYEPKLKLGLTLTDQSNIETERLGDVEGDAISFLLTSSPGGPGKFRDDLTSKDKQNIATTLGGPIGEALISGYANTLLSGIMLDFLRANSITFVSTAELRYVGAQPDLRLSGELYNAYWSFGGRIFNDINNANVSLQLPLGSLIGNEKMRNFMVELERKNDALDAADTRRSSVTGARVYYRIAF